MWIVSASQYVTTVSFVLVWEIRRSSNLKLKPYWNSNASSNWATFEHIINLGNCQVTIYGLYVLTGELQVTEKKLNKNIIIQF